MSGHTWLQEDFEAPYVGSYSSWRCTVCGACGGLWEKPQHPFISGPAVQVSEDCQQAQLDMRAHAEESIERVRAKWKNTKGEHGHYASFFHDILRWNPERLDVIMVIDLIMKVEMPVLTQNRRMSLHDVREAFVEAGWRTVPEAVSDALEELGEET